MLSQTAEYALRAVLYLAARQGDGRLRVGDLAAALGIPRNYLSKTLHQLARAGVLDSSRGTTGGFRLARPAAEISLAEVVAPFNGPTGARICLLGRDACSDADPCAAHHRWKSVSNRVATFFGETMVSELLGRGGEGRSQPERNARLDRDRRGGLTPAPDSNRPPSGA